MPPKGPAKAESKARMLYLPNPLSSAVERAAEAYDMSITAYVRAVLLGVAELPELTRAELRALRKMGLNV